MAYYFIFLIISMGIFWQLYKFILIIKFSEIGKSLPLTWTSLSEIEKLLKSKNIPIQFWIPILPKNWRTLRAMLFNLRNPNVRLLFFYHVDITLILSAFINAGTIKKRLLKRDSFADKLKEKIKPTRNKFSALEKIAMTEFPNDEYVQKTLLELKGNLAITDALIQTVDSSRDVFPVLETFEYKRVAGGRRIKIKKILQLLPAVDFASARA